MKFRNKMITVATFQLALAIYCFNAIIFYDSDLGELWMLILLLINFGGFLKTYYEVKHGKL